LWQCTVEGKLITFDTLRKLSLDEKWFKGYIDKTFDMIMVDETQDFDIMMLNMLLNDTTIPKLFVGDPMQSIYQWRGCINGFDKLPKTALTIEFYSTFRIGDPACELIRSKFKDCWMVSKSSSLTQLSDDVGLLRDQTYTYLFRTWKALFTSATFMPKVWIYKYEQTVEKMRKLHSILSFSGTIDDDEFEDDLPGFLRSITKSELESIISNIDANLTSKSEASCKMYTIHSYKGLEDDNIRIGGDIEDATGEDANLYYVALTRGMKLIVEDKKVYASTLATVAKEQKTIEDYFTVKSTVSGSGEQKPHGMFAGVRR
jgi:superfamily I DNA/RNA helicase